jgi:hypothetical protein
LRIVPVDGITTVVMHVQGLSGFSRMIDLSVRRRSLLAFTSNRPVRAGARAEAQSGEGDGAVPTVPWEEWGPNNTHALELMWLPSGALDGERRAMVLQVPLTRIMMHDYNPFRVRRALARTGGPWNEIKLECGSVMKVVAEKSVCRKSEWFVDGIESSLPYVETVTPYPGCERIIMDVNYLLAEVRTEVSVEQLLMTL